MSVGSVKKNGPAHEEAMELQNEVAALTQRLRTVEILHTNDKAEWKLKLESALASARQASKEAEDSRTKYDHLQEEHDLMIRGHRIEKARLESNGQQSERQFRKIVMEGQREYKLRIAELTADIRTLQVTAKECNLAHQQELETLRGQHKTQVDELLNKISTQRSQVEQLNDDNKKALELCEQLSQEQKKQGKEVKQAQAAQHSSSLEIAFLREEINTAKQREEELIQSTQKKMDVMKEKLAISKRKEDAAIHDMVDLQHQLRDHARIIEKQDKDIDAWKVTAVQLEKCLAGVVGLESREESSQQQQQRESLQQHVMTMIKSLQRYIRESKMQVKELNTTSGQLQQNITTLEQRVQELEVHQSQLRTTNTENQETITKLWNRNQALEQEIQQKQQDVAEWEMNYNKIESSVEDLMKLEKDTSAGYQER